MTIGRRMPHPHCLAMLLLWPCVVAAAESPWADLARADIDASHRLLQENHPGAVESPPGEFVARLEKGLEEALALAARAKSFAEYQRSLQRFMNALQDNHVHVAFDVDFRTLEWPGFLVVADDSGLSSVSVRSSVRAEVPDGARLLRCDATDVGLLLERNVFRYRTILEIPHSRVADVPYLLVDAGDPFGSRPRQCEIEIDGARRAVDLRWERLSREMARTRIDTALDNANPALALTRVDEGFVLSIPSFDWWGSEAARMQSFLEELRQRAAEIQSADWLVIDVRGNRGGNSEWGNRILSLLWSPDWLDYVDSLLDDSVAWRASPGNIAALREIVAETVHAFGDAAAADYWRDAADGMARALATRSPFFADLDASGPRPPPATNPMAAAVYFLTDYRCASACLNFADVLLMFPGVLHVGLPTAADTNYIDVRSELLPSGLGRLFIAMKVYTHRRRGSNVWYEPEVKWPGGRMIDEAIIAWIRALHAAGRRPVAGSPPRR